MKIKTKLEGLFLLSISLSVILFLFSTYYILHYGYFSGVTESDMKNALSDSASQLELISNQTMEQSTLLQKLNELNSSYNKMEFALLTKQGWIAEEGLPVIKDTDTLLDIVCLQKGVFDHYIISAKALHGNLEETVLICYVSQKDYEAMTYSFNEQRSNGILGKIAIFGMIVTVIITGFILFLFTKRERKNFDEIQTKLSAFELVNPTARMKETGNDELTMIAKNFNQMADRIQMQYEEKMKYEQNRKDLVSNLSHDLRTPLSSILGYTEMLRDDIYENEIDQKKYIDVIHRKAEYMEHILTELLEYSRVELGKLRLNCQRMNLSELMREILIEYYPVIEQKQYELKVDIPDTPVTGCWDRDKLSRVIRNLIDNALKYGMDGKKLEIDLSQRDGKTIIQIRDYGVGMEKETVEHIFEQFYRADHARNSKSGGMGLGMYVVKEIIRLHGGTIEIESKPKEGTNVRIIL